MSVLISINSARFEVINKTCVFILIILNSVWGVFLYDSIKREKAQKTHWTHMPLMQIKLYMINITEPSNDHIVVWLGLL